MVSRRNPKVTDLNNFAISSDGIATALQDSASSLMAAGNNLEQSVAMIAAANKVLQDPNSVGSALRTISLRIRGTSVKQLEELGEEVDGVVESTSKLQAKVKGLSGVDILTDTGAYKDTYTIIKEIAQVWDQMNDMDRAALLELLAGKNRSNAMAALLTNLEDLEGAYESAMEAQGSADAENEKYMNSIQGKIDQFNNALQTMWSNTISSDFVKGIVDLGTGIVKVVDNIGLLSSAIITLSTIKLGKIFLPKVWTALSNAIKGNIAAAAGETAAIEALNGAKVKEAILNSTKISDDIKAAAIKAILTGETGNETVATNLSTVAKIKEALATQKVTGENAEAVISAMGLTGANTSLAKSFGIVTKSILKFLVTNPVGWAMLAIGAITAVVAVNKKLKQAEEEAAEAAKVHAEEVKESNKSLDEYKTKVEELRKSLDSGNLSEEEAYDARKQLIEIQNELIAKYGKEAEAINLVTGEIEAQKSAIDNLAKSNAQDWLNKNSKRPGWLIFEGDSPITQAIDAVEKKQDTYSGFGTLIFNNAFKKAYDSDKWKEESKKAALEYQKFVESLGGTLELNSNIIRFKNVTKEQIEENFDKITNWLREYAAKTGNKIDFNDMIGEISAEKEKLLGDDFEVQKANYETYLENTAITSYTDAYGKILDAQDKFSKAYASGDKEASKEAKDELEAAIEAAKKEAGTDTRMAGWFDGLDDDFQAAFSDIDFDTAWDDAGTKLKSDIQKTLKDINLSSDQEILNLGSFIDDDGKLKDGVEGFTQEQVNAYNALKSKASEYGMEIEELVAKLVKLGLIQGSVAIPDEKIEAVGKTFSSYSDVLDKFTSIQSIQNEIIYDNIKLTDEQGDALKELIGDEEDYAEAVDSTNGYVIKNAKLVKDLIARKKAESAQNVKTEKTQARLKYYDLYKQIRKLSGANGELAAKNKDQINTLYAEMGAIQKTIAKYSMLEQKLLGAADAYDEFEEAQTVDSESDYSSKMTDMLTGLINGLQTGKIGTETFKAAVKGLIPDSELDKLDSVKDKVKAIADYVTTSNFKDYFKFEFDDDGTLQDITMTLDNVKAFIEDGFTNGALTQTGADWTQFELSDQVKTLDDLAKAYDLTKEAAFAYFQLINQYDGEWLNGDFGTTFDALIPTAASIKEAGEQMQKAFDQANVDLTLRPRVSWEKMNEAGWDTEEGSYSTVSTVTYLASDFGLANEGSSEDYAINVTPILPDGTVIKGGEAGLWEYINGKKNSGENIEDLDIFLGKYDSVQEAEEYAQALHEIQELYFSMVDTYSIDNDISNTVSKISELDNLLANGKITQDEYMAKMYGIGDAATEAQKATDGLKGNLDALGDSAREEIQEWQKASDGYADAKEKVAELEEKIKNASEDELPSLQEELKRAATRMANFAKEMSDHEYTELTVQFAIDDVQKDIDEIEAKYTNFADSVEFDNDSGKFVIKSGIVIPQDQADEFNNYIALLNEKHTLEVAQGEEMPTILDVLSEIKDILEKAYTLTIDTSDAFSKTSTFKDLWDNIKDKSITLTTIDYIIQKFGKNGEQESSGTANISGSAHVSGNWGLKQSEKDSLVGELGMETVVDPSTGRYYTVGDNGAELVDLPKGAIIFNHRQTEELFKNGHINSRGKAYAEGNAHVTIVPDFTTKSNYSGANSYWTDFASSISDSADSISDAADKFEEVFDWFEILLEEIEDNISLMNAKLENTIGISAKKGIYSEIINTEQFKLQELYEGIKLYSDYANKLLAKVPDQYKEMAKNGAVAITDFLGEANEEVVESINNYREWAKKVTDLNQQLEETKKTIADTHVEIQSMIKDEYDNRISLITSVNDRIQETIDLLDEEGKRSSAVMYEEMIKNSTKQLSELQNKRAEMQKALDEAVKLGPNGGVEKYSTQWYEMVNAIGDVDSEINDCKISLEGFQNSINQLHWDNFEKLIDAIDNVGTEISNLGDLIDEEDVVDDVGNWTNKGITALGLYAQEMERAKYRAEQYGKEIEYLNEQYAAGKYSEDEYLEKLQELKDGQWDSIKSYESAKKAIVDLNKTRVEAVKDGIQKEIDAYSELIDKKKEELNLQKDAHDFQKQVAEQQKNIADIQKKLAALSGDNSASAIAQRKKLEAELAAAQEELDEIYYNHRNEKQQEALDKSLEDYQDNKQDEMDALDESLKNEEQIIADSYATIAANTESIAQTLSDIASEYGITLSDSVTKPWLDGANAIGTYQEKLDTSMSSFTQQLETIKNMFADLQAQADSAGKSMIDAINGNKSKTEGATYTPPAPSQPSKPSTPSKPSAPSTGSSVTVKKSATRFSRDGGNGTRMQSWVPGSTFTVYQVSGSEVLIGRNGQYTGWVRLSDIEGYSSGTKKVSNDQLALIDELGEELVLHAGKDGRLQFLTKGTSVIPADITSNLMKLGSLDPKDILERNRPSIGAPHVIDNSIELKMEFGSLVHVDTVSNDTLPYLQKMVRNEFDNCMKHVNQGLKKFVR